MSVLWHNVNVLTQRRWEELQWESFDQEEAHGELHS